MYLTRLWIEAKRYRLMILKMTDENNDMLHTVDRLCSTSSAIESHVKNSLPSQMSPSFVFMFITLYEASLSILILFTVNA